MMVANSQQERYLQERYRQENKLGAGTMGEVWLATDTLLNRRVAIKYLSATDNTIHKELFLSEAQVLASLNHPNITLIYDAVFDETQKQYYIVMEYVEGKSLADLIDGWSGPLPLDMILDVTLAVLEALAYAHQKDIVHRDIKPENVIIQVDGVKLTDFGLAGLASILAGGKNQMVGTPTYISPEQILGRPTDGRSDLYSLGGMVFEMASGGHELFPAYEDVSELLKAHLEKTPPALKKLSPTVPLALDYAVQRLLAKAPEDRYSSAEAAITAFRAIQARQTFSQPHLNLLETDLAPLIGRDDELNRLETIWARSRQILKPHLVVVQGELGIGKNRLITKFLGHSVVDKGDVALVGRCDETGAPYAPFAKILVTILDKAHITTTISKSELEHLLSQVPGLARLLNIAGLTKLSADGDDPHRPVDDLLPAQWQFFTTILTILSDLGPTVIYFEEAHFLDEASIALIKFLLRQDDLPLLFVLACRPNKLDGPMPIWLDSLSNDEKTTIALSALSHSAIKGYLTHLLKGDVSEAVVKLIKQRSRGNPLQVEEVARQLVDSDELVQDETGQWCHTSPPESEDVFDKLLPETALDAFTRRLEKLTQHSREALTVAALIEPGPEFDFDIWLALLGGSSQEKVVQEVLAEALAQRVLRIVSDSRYAFRPASIATSLTHALPKKRQRDLHRQIAEVMHGRESDPILVGHHYEQAGLAIEAAGYLTEAANRAMAANAIQTAITYFNRVVTLVESQSAHRALGNLYRQQGKWADSYRNFQQALILIEQARLTSNGYNIIDHTRALNGVSFTLWLADRYREAQEHASAVLKLPDVPETERATAQSHLGMILWLMGHLHEAESWCQRAVNTLRQSEDGAGLAGAYNRLGLVHLAQGRLGEAQAAAQQSLALRQRLSDYWGEGFCLTILGDVVLERGNFEQAQSFYREAQRLFEIVDSHDGLMVVFTRRGRVLLYQNRPNDALPVLSQALQLALEIGKRSAYGLGEIYFLIAQACLARDDMARAKAATNDALKLVVAAGNRQYIALGQAILAQIYAIQDDPTTAEAYYRKSLALFEQVGHRPGLLRTRLDYAQFLEDQKDRMTATSLRKSARAEAAEMGLYLYNDRSI